MLPTLEGKSMETVMDGAKQTANSDQAMVWNEIAGRAWVELQALLDDVMKPFEDLLVEGVRVKSARQVLDVGCGSAATTLAVARLLGAKGRCTGIDISHPLIAAARARAEQDGTKADFILADAQRHVFAPASFDMIVSRFGVMFFDDSVRAFANLRHAAKDGAALLFLSWRSPEENPFMTTAEHAAAPLLSNIPARQPDAPGQFAFSDRRRVIGILEESGWTEIDIQAVDVPCNFPEKDLVRYFTQLGPLGRILHEADEQTRTRIIEKVRAAFDSYVHGNEVHFTAACWMVAAQAGSNRA
jgi:ubiquinone/menaquinone biosynthesis C-methylase UbiE